MKKQLLYLAAALPLAVNAQITVFEENFDAYNVGDYAASSSANITTWSNQPGGAEDAFISDFTASSGSNSVHIIGNTGPTDLVVAFPSTYTSELVTFSMKYYVASGKGAYFNCQETTTAGAGWKLDAYFDANGTGSIDAGGTAGAATFNFLPGTWLDISIAVNLPVDSAEFIVDGNVIHKFKWSPGVQGNGTAVSFGGVNLFAYGPNAIDSEYYVDDIKLQTSSVGIAKQERLNVNIAPNPSKGNFILNTSGLTAGTYSILVYDIIGNKVADKKLNLTTSDRTPLNFDLSAGTYLLRMERDNFSVTKKVIVE